MSTLSSTLLDSPTHHPRTRVRRLVSVFRWPLLALLAVLGLAGAHHLAKACTQPPPNPPTIQIMPLTNGCVKIIICDYTTFGGGRGMFCACALKRVSPIVAVKSVEVVQIIPGQPEPVPLTGFGPFQPNANTSQFFNNTAGGNWGGFLGAVTQTIEPGLPIKIIVVVQLAPGATMTQLQTALQQGGPIVGTGGATPAGTPTGDHLEFRPAGPVVIMPAAGAPHIENFFPKQGGNGTMITIIGGGFGNNPNDICAIIMDGDRSIPLRVLSASDDMIMAKLGPVAPGSQPGPIMIALGHGNMNVFKPAFPEIAVVEPAWVWVRTPDGPTAASPMNFTPLQGTFTPASPITQPTWFFSGPPMDGKIMLVLSNEWPNPSKIRIQARAHDHTRGIGRDLDAYCIEMPTGGTILDCAYRICDTIRCAFMQQGMVAVNCTAQQIGPNAVKLTLSMPDGQIGWGNLNVCVEPTPPKPGPVITGVSTNQACPGDMFFIYGMGFGNNPQNLCVVLMLPNNVSVPLQVIDANDTQIKVMLGAVECPAAGGILQGQIMVGLGDGNMGVPTLAFTDVAVRMPIWAWNKTGPATTANQPFNVICKPPPPTQQWFFSGPPTSDGRICLTLDKPWTLPAKVQIQARAHDHQRGIGRDLHAVCIELTGPGATGAEGLADCAARICDVITCAFRSQAGIEVNCTVELDPLNPNAVRLYLSLPDGQIGWGNLNVCVEPLPPPPAPIITGVSTNTGCPGDVFCIFGRNFGNCPENICAVIMLPNGISIPLQVIAATDDKLTVVVPDVACNTGGGVIMVGLGKGAYGRFKPAFADVTVADDVWVWDRAGGPMAGGVPITFQVICKPPPPPPAPQPQWFFSGPPMDGKIMLVLSNAWPAPAKIRIQARAHNHATGVGRDLEAYCIELQGGGSLMECAKRICDTIRCAFLQQGGFLVECTVTDLENGTVKLTLALPQGSIDWGNFNVCVEPGAVKLAPVITGVSTNRIKEGDMLFINGANFGNNPDNLCAVVMSGAESIPLEVVEATGTQIKTVVGVIRPGTAIGTVMVGCGSGAKGTFRPLLTNIVVRKPVWVWNRNRGPAANGVQFIAPVGSAANTTNVWFFSGPPTNGMLMTVISGNWPANAMVRIEARAHNHATGTGHDLRAPMLQFAGGGTLQQCAAAICDSIRCAFLQQAGIVVNCQITQLSQTQIKLTLTLPNGLPINWGNFNICVSAPVPEVVPVITSFTPTGGGPGTLITVRGTNFPTDPNDVCMVIMNGGISVPIEVLTSVKTQVVGRLGPVRPAVQPGPIMIGIGDGARGRFRPAFFDVFVDQDVWVWQKTGPAAMTTQPFNPIPQPPPPQQQWFFSGQPMDGQIMLVLSNTWTIPSKVTIQARAHDHEKGIGRDLTAYELRFTGGGSLLDCALRICDSIRCAFLQQAGLEVNCTVLQQADGTVKITLSLPDGRIGWGNLNVCVEPVPTAPAPVITNVTPLTGTEGTIIRVKGTNFPTDPNDVCMVIMNGGTSLPVEVIQVTPGEIVGRLGPVNPQAQPGPIMIGIGEGQRGRFRPAFFDIFVEEPVWTWNKTGPAAMGPVFTPVPTPPPPQQQWFFSGPPTTEGKICLTLTGNWPANAKLRIQARAHDHQRGIGRDLEAFCIRLPNGGSLLDCAKRICDVIRCAFMQQAGLAMNATAEIIDDPTGNQSVKITLSLPDGQIGWGNLNVCVEAPPTVPTPVVITAVTPVRGTEGDIITIIGTGFGQNPDNLCAVVMSGPASVPMEVIEATDTQIRARLGAVPPGTPPGPIMVGRGLGSQGRFRPAFFDVFVADDVWTWDRKGGPMANAPGVFTPIPQPPPPNTRWFFSGPPTNGVLCLYLTGNWPDPAKIRIEARAHDHQRGIGHDLRGPRMEWGSFSVPGGTGGPVVVKMDLLTCAYRICDSIACAFQQQAGLAVNCEVNQINTDVVKVVLSLPDGNIDWGNFNVCVTPKNDDPGPVLEIANDTATTTLPHAVLCWPRTRVGYAPLCVDELGQTIPWAECPEPLRVEGGKLKVRAPRNKPHEFFRLYRQPPVLTNPD